MYDSGQGAVEYAEINRG